METNRNRKVFGVYRDETAARSAVEELLNMGYTGDEISVVSKNSEMTAHDADGRTGGSDTATEAGLKGGAATGAAVGGLGGLLASLGLLVIPGVGPILAAGPIAATLAGAVTGGAIGGTVGTLGGALADSGASEEDIRYIDERFQAGDIIVYVDVNDDRYETVSRTLGYRKWDDNTDPGVSYGETDLSGIDRNTETSRGYMTDQNLVNTDSTSGVVDDNVRGLGRTADSDVSVRDANLGSNRGVMDDTVNEAGNGSHVRVTDVDARTGRDDDSTLRSGAAQRMMSDRDAEDREIPGLLNDQGTGSADTGVDPLERNYGRTMAESGGVNPVNPVYDKDTVSGDHDNRTTGHTTANEDRFRDDYNRTENRVQDAMTDAKHDAHKNMEKVQRRSDNADEPMSDAQNWAGDRASDVKHEAQKLVDKAKNRKDDK